MVTSTQHLIESVREETDRMLKATSSAAHDAQVAMPASQFRKLADWLAQLCDVLEESERGTEGRQPPAGATVHARSRWHNQRRPKLLTVKFWNS